MAFANLSVLAVGSLLMGIPILLHLMMKKRPRHQVFPALRFLHQRQQQNKRQMQLRNWLLLALRLLAVGLLALLFARPSVDSASMGYWLRALLLGVLTPIATVAWLYSWMLKRGRVLTTSLAVVTIMLAAGLLYFAGQAVASLADSEIGDPQAPVAAVLVFDTAPRMNLRHQNQTRLEEAQRLARELLRQLPIESEVAVVDADSQGNFSLDIGVAANLIDSLQVRGSELPLSQMVERAIQLVRTRENKRREVHVFTDLSRAVWDTSPFRALRQPLEEANDVAMFVLDVGVEEPRNVRLGEPRLSTQSLQQGRPLRVTLDVHSLAFSGEAAVAISLEKADPTLPVIMDGKVILPELVRRDRVDVRLEPGMSLPISFDVQLQTPGIHHGKVTIDSQDGLTVDDVRYFTVAVRAPWPALIVAGPGAEQKYVESVMSPLELRSGGGALFDCKTIPPSELLDERLHEYRVVTLLDPDVMTPEHWQRLADFGRQGGGLAVLLGRNARSGGTETFNQFAGGVLPGGLRDAYRGQPVYFSIQDTAHPILVHIRDRAASIGFDGAPVFQYWRFDDLAQGANVVARFSNGDPAIVESLLGEGRVVTMSTPASDVRNDRRRPAWNHFPTPEDGEGFAFFAVMYGLFPYLAGESDANLNYLVKQPVVVPMEAAGTEETNWLLFTPQLDWQNMRSMDGRVTVASAEGAGTYRLKQAQQPTLGFSVNLPAEATDLERLPVEQLDEILGAEHYTLARGSIELNRGIGRSRVGRELFPFLAFIVVGLLAMEHLMSNRFYGLASPSRPSQRNPDPAAAP